MHTSDTIELDASNPLGSVPVHRDAYAKFCRFIDASLLEMRYSQISNYGRSVGVDSRGARIAELR